MAKMDNNGTAGLLVLRAGPGYREVLLTRADAADVLWHGPPPDQWDEEQPDCTAEYVEVCQLGGGPAVRHNGQAARALFECLTGMVLPQILDGETLPLLVAHGFAKCVCRGEVTTYELTQAGLDYPDS